MNPRTLALAGAVAAALAAPGAATAQSLGGDDDVTVSIGAGELVYTTPFTAENFGDVELGATPQLTYADVNDWVVTDNRGGLAGWKVQVQATQFKDDNGTAGDATDDKSLPTGSMTVAPLSAINPSTATTNLGTAPAVATPALAIDGAATPQNLAVAAVGTIGNLVGAGEWTFSHGADNDDLILSVAPGAQTGTYTSTITTTLSGSAL